MSRTLLFDFSEAEAAAQWRAVDDRVMGGISESALQPNGSFATFAGTVSLERGGGFASVRAPLEALDLSGFGEVVLRVRGDGRRYKLSLYPEPPPGAVRYQVPFETARGTCQTRVFDFAHFAPTFRGRAVPGAGPLDRSALYAASLLIADAQDGPFALDLAWIAVR